MSRWEVTPKPRRFLGNLIGPATYTLIELVIEGPRFWSSPNHIAYWGFACAIGILQSLRPRCGEWLSTALLIVENIIRANILLVTYIILESLTDARFSNFTDFIADPTHQFIILAIPLLGLATSLAEVTVQHYLKLLQKQNDELNAFAHTIAHDLKNSASAVIGFAEIGMDIYRQSEDTQLQEIFNNIARGGYKINTIIRELLLLANAQSGKSIPLTPLDMTGIIREAQTRLESLIEEHHAVIITPNSLPPAMGYAAWIEEVWLNYISNAIKYGGRPPHIEIGATPQSNNQIRFWVRDNGKGLSPELQKQLFTPFERLHQTDIEGHGLGLSIVRRIVERLGGQIGMTSEAGHGCTFYFTLAAVDVKQFG